MPAPGPGSGALVDAVSASTVAAAVVVGPPVMPADVPSSIVDGVDGGTLDELGTLDDVGTVEVVGATVVGATVVVAGATVVDVGATVVVVGATVVVVVVVVGGGGGGVVSGAPGA